MYLFRQDGAGLALCISHGSTRFDGGDFKPRPASETSVLMDWSRHAIGADALSAGMEIGINLGSIQKLSKAYETTTAFSRTYELTSIRSDEILRDDALKAVQLLGVLYSSHS